MCICVCVRPLPKRMCIIRPIYSGYFPFSHLESVRHLLPLDDTVDYFCKVFFYVSIFEEESLNFCHGQKSFFQQCLFWLCAESTSDCWIRNQALSWLRYPIPARAYLDFANIYKVHTDTHSLQLSKRCSLFGSSLMDVCEERSQNLYVPQSPVS